jgi:hypothetical protein
MEFKNKGLHQGDTQWFQINRVPENAKKVEKRFIATSERSDSFHALFGNYEMYEVEDGFVIDAKEECILNHSLRSTLASAGITMDKPDVLPMKDHRHSVIPKGIHFVGIQQRFDPLKGHKEKVRD